MLGLLFYTSYFLTCKHIRICGFLYIRYICMLACMYVCIKQILRFISESRQDFPNQLRGIKEAQMLNEI